MFPSRPLAVLLLLAAKSLAAATEPAPLLELDSDGACVLNNGVVTATIDAQGLMTALREPGGPNLIESGYLVGPYLRDRSAATSRLVRNTPEIAEVAYAFRASNLAIELHYVIRPATSGVYCFLELVHDPKAGAADDALGFFKHVIKADAARFNFQQSTDTQQGFVPPESARIEEVNRDHTYLLNPAKFDNVYCRKYYSKYDYMHYASEHGVYGLYSPGSRLGLYVIHASVEWTPGGPTKSFQTVHDPAVINTIINDEHMLQNFYQVNRFPADAPWRKLAGPFLIYVNRGATAAEAWNDARTRAAAEAAAWPYAWMDHPDFPLARATVRGALQVAGGSAANAWCVLADPETDWQDQCLGYIYSTRADAGGNFAFSNVRPGNYALHAFSGTPPPSDVETPFNNFKSPSFRIPPGRGLVKLGTLAWKNETHGPKLFQIGMPDRTTREFRLGNLRRQYGLWEKTPATLDYTVLSPDRPAAERAAADAQQWCYLQSESGGTWRIHFSCPETPAAGRKAWLSLALAGTCKRPQLTIAVNGRTVWRSGDEHAVPAATFGDDSSVRRCAVNGAYQHDLVIPFDAALLKKGAANVLALTVDIPGKNKEAGGIMYDALKLELAPPDAPKPPGAN